MFSSGALNPDGSIAGNDGDADGTRYEPHHFVAYYDALSRNTGTKLADDEKIVK